MLAHEKDTIAHETNSPTLFAQYGELFIGISHESFTEDTCCPAFRADSDKSVRIHTKTPMQIIVIRGTCEPWKYQSLTQALQIDEANLHSDSAAISPQLALSFFPSLDCKECPDVCPTPAADYETVGVAVRSRALRSYLKIRILTRYRFPVITLSLLVI
jgi:ferredoxin